MAKVHVAAVRPYSQRIRGQVFGTLTHIGVEVETLVEARTSDDEALRALQDSNAEVLLIPFHAHRDRDGQLVNGLDLISRLRQEVPRHRETPILCPVSNVGLAAAGLITSREDAGTLDGVLLLEEGRLGERDTPHEIARFLGEHGLSVRTSS